MEWAETLANAPHTPHRTTVRSANDSQRRGPTEASAGAVTGADNYDDILLEGVNSDTVDRKLTIEWGGVTAPDDLIELTLPAEGGLVMLVRGILQNSLVVRAFAASANVVLIRGQVWKVRA